MLFAELANNYIFNNRFKKATDLALFCIKELQVLISPLLQQHVQLSKNYIFNNRFKKAKDLALFCIKELQVLISPFVATCPNRHMLTCRLT